MGGMKNRIAATAAALALTASLVTPAIASAEENPAPINVAPSIAGILKPSISTQAEGTDGTAPASDYNTDPAPINNAPTGIAGLQIPSLSDILSGSTDGKKIIPLAPYGIPYKDIPLGSDTILRIPDKTKVELGAVKYILGKIGYAVKGNDNAPSQLLG